MAGSLQIGYIANLAVGGALLALGWLVWRLSADRQVRTWLAIFLALVAGNYTLDALGLLLDLASASPPFLGPLAAALGRLDPPFLLLAGLAIAGVRVRPAVAALVISPNALLVLAPRLGAGIDAETERALFLATLVVCYLTAFVLVARRYLRAQEDLDRHAVLVVASALICLPRLPLVYVDLGLAYGVAGRSQPQTLVLEAGLALAFVIFALFARAFADPSMQAHARRTVASVGALLLVVALAWLLRFVPPLEYPAHALLYSVRWVLIVAVVTAGARRHEVFGMPTEVARPLRYALLALLAVASAGMIASLMSALLDATPGTAILSGFAVVLVVGMVALAVRTALPPPRGDIAWRRESVYRAHVVLGTSEPELEDLRRRLGLGEREARRIRDVARLERAVPVHEGSIEPSAIVADRYRVDKLVGMGTFGRAFAATDRRDGSPVILKELRPEWHADPEALSRFRREAEVVLEIVHPNLVAFRAVEPAPGGHVLVLERVEGETLAARLQRGPLSAADAGKLARQLLAGLGALHARGIIHRDVKPANIMLARDGRAVLLDMGAISRDADATLPSGAHPGSPAYMSPEQAHGSPVDATTDLYALAVVLWESLAGKLPPHGELPRDWVVALTPALGAQRGSRYPNARAFAAALPA